MPGLTSEHGLLKNFNMTKVIEAARPAAKIAEYRRGIDGFFRATTDGLPGEPLPNAIQTGVCDNGQRVIATTKGDVLFLLRQPLDSEQQPLAPARYGLPDNLTVWQVGCSLFFKSQIPENGF